jgi:hypothetical protein
MSECWKPPETASIIICPFKNQHADRILFSDLANISSKSGYLRAD